MEKNNKRNIRVLGFVESVDEKALMLDFENATCIASKAITLTVKTECKTTVFGVEMLIGGTIDVLCMSDEVVKVAKMIVVDDEDDEGAENTRFILASGILFDDRLICEKLQIGDGVISPKDRESGKQHWMDTDEPLDTAA